MSSNAAKGTKDPKGAIRFKISYASAKTLLTEFTRSVSRGNVTIESRKAVPVGTKFIFELYVTGVPKPVEVDGEVLKVTPGAFGGYLLHITYNPGEDRGGLDGVIGQILDAQKYERVRRYPRLPLNLRATEEAPNSPAYLVRDLSLGGMGLEVEAVKLPPHIKVGVGFLCEFGMSIGTLQLMGKVAWLRNPPPEKGAGISPGFGVEFADLDPETMKLLEQILKLQQLPPPPWKVRLRFGRKPS